ncbi:hypothetical protein [Psychrobacter sp. AOP7-B1-24]|uniref:hypothetical protein n=1 Tax=Psychrobacter sp. AOP7-B1-24 TaxID=3457645 RepID=UPI00402B5425
MKNLKTSALISSLLLSTPLLMTNSYAHIDSSEFEKCYADDQKVLAQPLITRQAAITMDQEQVAEIEMVRQLTDTYVMDADIADLPSFEDIEKHVESLSNEEMMEAVQSGELISSEGAEESLMFLFQSYYIGEYVPKDEPKAIRYLNKLIEYHQPDPPKHMTEIKDFVMVTVAESLLDADKNSTDTDIMLATYKVLFAAGVVDKELLAMACGSAA